MKNPNFTKQTNSNPRPFPLTQLSPKLDKQCLDSSPFDITTGWSGKYRIQCFLVWMFHMEKVSYIGTVSSGNGRTSVAGSFSCQPPPITKQQALEKTPRICYPVYKFCEFCVLVKMILHRRGAEFAEIFIFFFCVLCVSAVKI